MHSERYRCVDAAIRKRMYPKILQDQSSLVLKRDRRSAYAERRF